MKNYALTCIFFLCVSFSYAQLNINTYGNVGVKTNPLSTKSVLINGKVEIQAYDTQAWESAIGTKVSQKDACAYHLYNSYYSQDVFFICGEGYIWCKLGGYFGSDLSMKEDIREIDSPLEKVLKLHGVKYKYKDGKETDKSKLNDRMGLIAQDVEKVFPEVVKEMQDGSKAIAYTDLIGALVEAIKEQQVEIEELKKQLNK